MSSPDHFPTFESSPIELDRLNGALLIRAFDSVMGRCAIEGEADQMREGIDSVPPVDELIEHVKGQLAESSPIYFCDGRETFSSGFFTCLAVLKEYGDQLKLRQQFPDLPDLPEYIEE